MQHPLQISRRIEYGLRAMTCLAAQPEGKVMPFREIARRMNVPQDFLAKILKQLVTRKLAVSTRGARGGYRLGRPAREITFLEVIEAVEGPVVVNLCQDGHDGCRLSHGCTLYGVWKRGQERMLDVYRTATLDQLAMAELKPPDLTVMPVRPAAAAGA
ncbi:MAG TPA: Rrf2 family transcriptional regulator [Myxococcaceae bacterium]|nr:Rrf2 family transcriptional regulator [Myxococcaceae bacterium]